MYIEGRLLILLVVLVGWLEASPVHNGVERTHHHRHNNHHRHREHSEECIGCVKEQQQQQQHVHLTEDEIREIRIEEIKRQILKKLRLKHSPNVTLPLNLLPAPLSDGEITGKAQPPQMTRDIDEFYGRTEQIILFPVQNKCAFSEHDDPATCFTITFKDDMFDRSISAAELWLYKLRDRRDSFNQTFIIAELPSENHSVHKKRTKFISQETDLKSGWMKLDLQALVHRWLQNHPQDHRLEVSCRKCARGAGDSPVSWEPGQRPFLVLRFDSKEEKQRTKRSINCSPDTTVCCREFLDVSFKEIGWDNWIIEPDSYQANYCRGSCTQATSLPISMSHYTTVMQKLVQNKNLTAELKNQLQPCCTPTAMSAISLLYLDDNGNIYHKNLPNIAVDACGCS